MQTHIVPQGGSLAIECRGGTVVTKVRFASFGACSRLYHDALIPPVSNADTPSDGPDGGDDGAMAVVVSMLAGASAGGLSVCLNQPVDVVKRLA